MFYTTENRDICISMRILDKEKLIQSAAHFPTLYGGLKITNRINEQLEKEDADQTQFLYELLFTKQDRSFGTVIDLIYESYVSYYDLAAGKQLADDLTKLSLCIDEGKDQSNVVSTL